MGGPCGTPLFIIGWGGWTRTSDHGSKVRCLTNLATPQCYAK